MNKVPTFLLRISLFLSPVLLGLGWLEYQQHILPNNYTAKKEGLEAGLHKWETLILGSSHTYLGLNPEYFPHPTYNLAFTAQTLYFDHFLLKKYIDQMPKLRQVIVPVSYSSFATESYINPGDYNKSYYYAYFYGSKAFINPLNPRCFSLNSLFTVKRAVDRTLDYYQHKDSLVEFSPNGWYYSDLTSQRPLARNAEESGRFHDYYYDEDFYPANVQRIVDIAALCQKRNVRLFLITTPHWSGYFDNVKADRLEKMQHTADSLSARLHVPYLNYLRDTRFVDDDFFDSNHLLNSGAKKLSLLLVQEIENKTE